MLSVMVLHLCIPYDVILEKKEENNPLQHRVFLSLMEKSAAPFFLAPQVRSKFELNSFQVRTPIDPVRTQIEL